MKKITVRSSYYCSRCLKGQQECVCETAYNTTKEVIGLLALMLFLGLGLYALLGMIWK